MRVAARYVSVVQSRPGQWAKGWLEGGYALLSRFRGWSGTREGRGFLAVLAIGMLVRMALAPMPIFPNDPQYYVAWGVSLRHHPLDFYTARTDATYPPLAMYIFFLIDVANFLLAHLFGQEPSFVFTQSALLIVLEKLPMILVEMATIALVYALARRELQHRWALVATASYALSPFILGIGPLWGQSDGLFTLPVVLACVFALRGRMGWAGAMCALAVTLKPQPVVFVPLLLLYALRWAGRSGAFRFLGGLAGTGIVVCLPMLLPPVPQLLAWAGNVQRLQLPRTTFDALNFWWVLGEIRVPGGHVIVATQDANGPWLGPLSPTKIGLAIFAVCFLIAAAGIWRQRSAAALFSSAALVSLAFFMFTTEQRGRYIYPTLVLFLLAAIYERRYAIIYAATSVFAFLNVAIYITQAMHTLHLDRYLARPYHFLLAHYWLVHMLAVSALVLMSVVLWWHIRRLPIVSAARAAVRERLRATSAMLWIRLAPGASASEE
jgi:dolichyl-phosphate-mannose-protein mannosyltransferase